MVYGVGINDVDGPTIRTEMVDGKRKKVWSCPYYKKWIAILERCYSTNLHLIRPSYIGCVVSGEWRLFSNFKIWMMSQDWQGKELDKDLLSGDNKIYSKETCLFVDSAVNSFLTDRAGARGRLPLGVYLKQGRYCAQVQIAKKRRPEHLGYFDNPNDAHLAWKTRKHELACELADAQSDERVANALRNKYGGDHVVK